MTVVKTILFCARHNLPLREHREQGSLVSDGVGNACLIGEQGVFRGFLSFRVDCGDTDLWKHFEEALKNCSTISPQLPNEIIEAVGMVVEKKSLRGPSVQGFFSFVR